MHLCRTRYMKCPKCGNECKKGYVKVKDAGSLTQSLTMVTWYSEENVNKILSVRVAITRILNIGDC